MGEERVIEKQSEKLNRLERMLSSYLVLNGSVTATTLSGEWGSARGVGVVSGSTTTTTAITTTSGVVGGIANTAMSTPSATTTAAAAAPSVPRGGGRGEGVSLVITRWCPRFLTNRRSYLRSHGDLQARQRPLRRRLFLHWEYFFKKWKKEALISASCALKPPLWV